MNAISIGNLRDLVGGWSCLAFAVGLVGAFIGNLSLRGHNILLEGGSPAKVICWLSVVMLLCAFFIGGAGALESGSYQFPADRAFRRYDNYFAQLIALTFGMVFAFDAIRLRILRKPITTVE